MVLSLTLHKGMTKRIIRDAGLATPPFRIVYNPDDCRADGLQFPLFVKPNAEGTGKGITSRSKVETQVELEQVCGELLLSYPSGLLVEEYLPGREFTVGILGTGADSVSAGIMEVIYLQESTRNIYSYQTKSEYEGKVEYVIPEKEMSDRCIDLALKSWNVLGCCDGGRIDLRVDRLGVPSFIEVNPLAGLDKVHSDLPILAYKHGYTYEQVIGAIMQSARKRTGLL